MKGIIVFVILIFLSSGSISSQEVLGSVGAHYSNPEGTITMTIGEPVSGTVTNGDHTLNQGFQQTDILAVPSSVGVWINTINVSVYPNPVSSDLIIDIKDTGYDLYYEIYGAGGKLIDIGDITRITTHVEMANYIRGAFLLVIKDRSSSNIFASVILKG